MLTLILLAATDPATPGDPGLRPGLTEDQITPGLLGFVMTFGIVLIMFFLIRDMVKRVRRVRYRAQVEDDRAGTATEYLGIPIMSEADMLNASYENGFRDTPAQINPEPEAVKHDAGTQLPVHTPASGAATEGLDAAGAASTQGEK
ncbi:hypothetical protein [Arthrobacter alpinus]|uniref:hypothetical protein n=1 Tax=Arthrobacter alpinus TaxID=656366 RepID=UPI000AF2E218|nr:hypothetical protein [Arthrobacter alpinus]